MYQPLFNKGFSGWGQLGVLLGLVGAGLIVGSMVSMGAWWAMTGAGLANLATDMLNPAYAGPIKVIQALSTFFGFFVPAVAFGFICFRNGWQVLGFSKPWKWKLAGISLLIIACSGPLIDSLSMLNKAIPLPAATKAYFDGLEKSYEAQVKVIAEVKTVGQLVVSLLLMALLPAMFEEVLFRGGLQGLLQRWWKKPWLAIVVASIIFSLVHASWYGFLPRIALGLLLGGIFYYTRNIWYAILVHVANNAVVVFYLFYRSQKGLPVSLDTEVGLPWWMGLVSLAVLLWLFGWLKKSRESMVPPEIFYESNNPFDQRNNTA